MIREPRPGLFFLRTALSTALTVLGIAAFPTGLAAQDPSAAPESLGDLRDEARSIVREIQDLELGLSEARSRVERLLRDLTALSRAEGWTPVFQRLEVTIARPGENENQTFEECPLFFEEELTRLCPLDQGRSEIWGSQVLVCVFACAPALPERDFPEPVLAEPEVSAPAPDSGA